jgi:hypothetical protein
MFFSTEQFNQIISNQKEILQKMASQNVSIQQFATAFNQMQADTTQFFQNQTAFNTKLVAFLQNLSSGATGTSLSTADQATLNSLQAEVAPLDTAAQGLNTTVSGITLPASS